MSAVSRQKSHGHRRAERWSALRSPHQEPPPPLRSPQVKSKATESCHCAVSSIRGPTRVSRMSSIRSLHCSEVRIESPGCQLGLLIGLSVDFVHVILKHSGVPVAIILPQEHGRGAPCASAGLDDVTSAWAMIGEKSRRRPEEEESCARGDGGAAGEREVRGGRERQSSRLRRCSVKALVVESGEASGGGAGVVQRAWLGQM